MDEDLKRRLEAMIQAEKDRPPAEPRRHTDSAVGATLLGFEIAMKSVIREIQLLAQAVTKRDEKADGTAETICAEMRQGFAETQTMIKLSDAELDKRVYVLEEKAQGLERAMADLEARLDRLESPAQ